MNKQEQESWNELVVGAKAVKLDHVPKKAIEDLFSTFIKDANAELGINDTPSDARRIFQGLGWLSLGVLYLCVLVLAKT